MLKTWHECNLNCVVLIIDLLMHLPQTKCVWHKEQCLLLPRLEDSHRRKPVHCSWVPPLFPLRFYSQNFELFITITCKNPAHCRFYWKIPVTPYYIPSGMQIECMLYSLRFSALVEKKNPTVRMWLLQTRLECSVNCRTYKTHSSIFLSMI